AIGLGAVVIVMGIIGLLRSRREAQPGTSAMTRFRDRALESSTSMATLAFSAIVIEAATMWPYLVGISLIAANGPGLPLDIFWLALYNVIMVLPATILTWARTKYPEQTDLLLSKTRETMTSAGSNFTAWLAILIGAWIIIAQLLQQTTLNTMPSDPVHHALPAPPSGPAIPWRQVTWFIIVTFALTWLVVLPLYFINDPQLFQTLYLPIALLMMGIPAFVSWGIVYRTQPKGQRAAALGFSRPRPVGKFLGYLGLAFIIPIGIVLLSLPIAAALGLYTPDLANFSGLQQVFEDAGAGSMPVEMMLLSQIVNVVIAAWVLNVLPAL